MTDTILYSPVAVEKTVIADFMMQCLDRCSFRCACCLNHYQILGTIAVYRNGGIAEAYGICEQCWTDAQVSEAAMGRLIDRCENYMRESAAQ